MIAPARARAEDGSMHLNRRSVMLTDEELLTLRSTAYLRDTRTAQVLHHIITDALETLSHNPDVRIAGLTLRAEKLGIHVVDSTDQGGPMFQDTDPSQPEPEQPAEPEPQSAE